MIRFGRWRHATGGATEPRMFHVKHGASRGRRMGARRLGDTPIGAEAERAVDSARRGAVARPPQQRVFTIANQKAASGKTTTASTWQRSWRCRVLKVLVIDLDPQGNATPRSASTTDRAPLVVRGTHREFRCTRQCSAVRQRAPVLRPGHH